MSALHFYEQFNLCGVGQVQGYNNDDGDDNNYNHNSFFLVSLDLAEHCTKWDFKSESQQIKSNVCLW